MYGNINIRFSCKIVTFEIWSNQISSVVLYVSCFKPISCLSNKELNGYNLSNLKMKMPCFLSDTFIFKLEEIDLPMQNSFWPLPLYSNLPEIQISQY